VFAYSDVICRVAAINLLKEQKLGLRFTMCRWMELNAYEIKEIIEPDTHHDDLPSMNLFGGEENGDY
jgi:hypothetical protein